ncbi:hypothetical protein Peur_041808 [Populus x canadensis]
MIQIELKTKHFKLFIHDIFSNSSRRPTLEFKPLSKHLKYVYLGKDAKLLMIIAKNLTTLQKEKLVRVLKDHKTTKGWTITDGKRISPSLFMH